MTCVDTIRLALLALVLVWAEGGIAADDGGSRKIELKRARIFTTHVAEGDDYKVADAIDGNSTTKWVGEGHPLPWQPTSVVLQFEQDEPITVQRVVLLTQTLREVLALKRFEIFAWGGDGKGWAGEQPLAVVKETKELRTVVDFPPTKTSRLRIRIHDTWRPDHAFPRLAEIEVFGPANGAGDSESRVLKTSPLPGEKQSEVLLLARAMGQPVVFPGTKFDPEKGFLYYARTFLDTMIREGTDRYGEERSPMFASILDMESHALPADPPANIPGQRFGDRSVHGGNLFHDVMLLRAADYLGLLTGESNYRQAATDYLRFFLHHCPAKRTGLFAWGEHAYWDFAKERPGHLTHEFLGGLPRSPRTARQP